MKLNTDRDTLLLALGRVQGIVSKKSTMPVLTNVLIETISNDRFSITATDLDIFTKGSYEGLSDEETKLCVNAKDFHDIIRNLPAGGVTVELIGGNTVKVASGKITYNIRSAPVDDYPNMPDFGEISYSELSTGILKDLIDHTVFSVANDDPRIFLNGVNFEKIDEDKLRMVSTDGHRLSLIDRSVFGDEAPDDKFVWPLESPVIIPRKGVVELRKLLDESGANIELHFSGSNGFFKHDNHLLIMRLIEGEFPDYNMVIPQGAEKKVKLNRASLQEALKRMSILSVDRSFGVRFKLDDGELVIESSDPDKGEGREVLEAEYEEEDMQIGFNAKYFLDAINVMNSETVVLSLSDELSPCVVRDIEDDGYLGVVMPVRIS